MLEKSIRSLVSFVAQAATARHAQVGSMLQAKVSSKIALPPVSSKPFGTISAEYRQHAGNGVAQISGWVISSHACDVTGRLATTLIGWSANEQWASV
jgi:hypothetical protein